jgi:hypothetical protein
LIEHRLFFGDVVAIVRTSSKPEAWRSTIVRRMDEKPPKTMKLLALLWPYFKPGNAAILFSL